MSSDNNVNVQLLDPNHAVDDYLDRLLDDGISQSERALPPEQGGGDTAKASELRDTGGLQEPVTPDTLPSCAKNNEESFNSDDSLESVCAADELPSLIKENPDIPARTEVDVDSKAVVDKDSEVDSKIPLAQMFAFFKFQAMGVNFAVSAEQYVGDFPYPEDIASEQEGPEWVLGEVLMDGKRIRIADIAVMVIPDSRRNSLRSNYRYRRVLQVGTRGWGFVCDGDVEHIELPFEKIHWRTKQGKRQWLAATIVDQKCALLDVNIVERILDHGEWGE